MFNNQNNTPEIILNLRNNIDNKATFYWGEADGSVVNLSGVVAEMHIKKYTNSPDTLLTLTQTNGIVVDEAEGKFEITIPYATAKTITWQTGVFDLLVKTPSDEVLVVASGKVIVSHGVTNFN